MNIGHAFVIGTDVALYQVVVSYDRDRTDALTNNDIIDTLTGRTVRPCSGQPTTTHPPRRRAVRHRRAGASLTLVRGAYTPEFQLILTSTPLSLRARKAIREAVRPRHI